MKIYTISEIVELTGLSDKTIRRAIQSSKLSATKEPGPRGLEYRITQKSLDKWLESRGEKPKNIVPSTDQSEQDGLIPMEYVQQLHAQLSNTAYRAGITEGQVRQLEVELHRVIDERNEERKRLQFRIDELKGRYLQLEAQYQQEVKQLLEQYHEQSQNTIELVSTIQRDAEERDKRFLEYIERWRKQDEVAATSEQENRRPWWKKLFN